MKKRTIKQRIIAGMVSAVLIATSVPASVFAEDITEANIGNDTGTRQEITLPEESVDEENLQGDPNTTTPGENSEGQAGNADLSAGMQQVPIGDTQDLEAPQVVYKDAQIRVSWGDVQNLADRRTKNPAELFTVYADGVEMQTQPKIIQKDEKPVEEFGVQTYTYIIKELPVTQPDGVTAITYTVSEKAPEGYTGFRADTIFDAEKEQKDVFLQTLAAEQEQIPLVLTEDESGFHSEKNFGNYLPAYQVSGTVIWTGDKDHTDVRPEMEVYFKNQFTITRNQESTPFTAYKVHYTQNEEDASEWNYTISGLFTTTADGSTASYHIHAGTVEAYESAEGETVISADRSDLKVTYTRKADPEGKEEIRQEEKQEADNQEDKRAAKIAQSKSLNASNSYTGVTAVTVKKEWLDNNDAQSKRKNLLDEEWLVMEYKEGNAGDWTTWTTGALGINDPMSDWTATDRATVSAQGVGWENYDIQLPEKVSQGKTEVDIQYRFFEKEEKIKQDSYVPYHDEEPNTFHNIISEAKEFEVKLNAGALSQEKRDKKIAEFAGNITLHGMDANGNLLEKKLSELGRDVTFPDSDSGSIKIQNLPYFTLDGVEIIYYLTMDNELSAETDTKGKGDKYVVTYDNAGSDNFGSVQDKCHQNGKLNITLTGSAPYEATKEWLDDGEEETIKNRPEATLYLWRYANRDGANYKTAAMVKDPRTTNPGNISWKLDKNKGTETINTEVIAPDGLEKYDPEGYEYIYFTREELSGSGYKQCFGKYNKESEEIEETSDMLPDGMETRTGTDSSVYNGGVLSNLITDTVQATVTKKWEAAAFQSQLRDVKVEFTLQSREVETAEWEDTKIKAEMDDFFAEQLVRTVTERVPKYNQRGIELEYQWIESAVYQKNETGAYDENLLDAAKQVFTLNQKDAEGIEQDVTYHSEYDPKDGMITNRIADKIDYTVKKIWNDNDNADGNRPNQIEIILYRDNIKYVVYDMKDKVQQEETVTNTDEAKKERVTAKQDQAWELVFEHLPKYDETGHRYSYYAEEVVPGGYHADYEYDIENRITKITNTPGTAGRTIKVRKEWIDDGDDTHRVPVLVEVYNKNTGEVYGSATLREQHFWWEEIGLSNVPATVTLNQLAVREMTTSVYTGSDVTQIENGKMVVSESEGTIFADTNNHKYQVTYGTDTDRNMLVVRNRRIGLIDLTVRKYWVDEGIKPENRPDATLSLSCVEYTDAVNKTNPSAGTVTIGEAINWPILDNNGSAVGATQALAKEQDDTWTLDPATGRYYKEYYFWNLPKYDNTGKVVHYEIKETIGKNTGKGDANEYKIKTTERGYTVGTQHSNDKQEIEVTNYRAATKEVKFYKLWKDKYNYESTPSLRPDIYLTLYKADSTTGNVPKVVEEYIDRKWSRGVNDSDYLWTCDFGALPKYDENGAEITYYARESTHVDAAALDYLTDDASVYDDGNTYSNEYGEPGTANVTVETEDGNVKVLKENGTFVNRVGAMITITGKKVWQNIPANIPEADFPELEIYVNRSTTKPEVQGEKNIVRKAIHAVTSFFTGKTKTPITKPKETDIAFTEKLQRIDGTNHFSFRIVRSGDNTNIAPEAVSELPKYDENGALYYYEVYETVANAENLAGTAYEKLPGAVNNFIITNVYETADEKNTGHLQVEKTWKGINTADLQNAKYVYPAVEFKLYRQYVSNDAAQNEPDGMTKPELVDTQRLKSGADNSGTVIFDSKKLRIYAPNGKEYRYYVEETLLMGYSHDATAANTTPQKVTAISLKNTTKAAPKKVSFTNEYTPEKIKAEITGTKVWKDHNNGFDTRIEINKFMSKLTVYRYAEQQNMADGAGAIKDEEITLQTVDPNEPYYFKLQADTQDKNTWMYTISNLDTYAPNAMPWKYKIVEADIAGYEGSPNAGGKTAVSSSIVDGDPTKIKVQTLTNSSLKKTSLGKIWDGTNAYGLRPSQIEVELWVKIGTSGTWEKAADAFTSFSGAKNITYNATVNKDSSWTYTFSDLPAYVNFKNTNEPCIYQIVETKIGTVAVSQNAADGFSVTDTGVTYPEAGAYKPSGTLTQGTSDFDADKTTIKNAISTDRTVKIKLSKTWNDTGDAYDTRTVTDTKRNEWTADYVLFRRVKSTGGWEQVQNVSDKKIILRLTGNNANNTAAMEYGPFPKYSDDGEEYEYAAVEIPVARYTKTESITIGTNKLEDNSMPQIPEDATVDAVTIMGSLIQEGSAVYHSETNTTNALTETTTATLTKQWYDEDSAKRPDLQVELQYQDSVGQTWKSFIPKLTLTLDGNADGNSTMGGQETTAAADAGNGIWTAAWSGIPKRIQSAGSQYDRSYRIVEVVPDGYIGSSSERYDETSNYIVSLKNIEKTSHMVVKKWGNMDYLVSADAPSAITYRLEQSTDKQTWAPVRTAGGAQLQQKIMWNPEEISWEKFDVKTEFKDLPGYDGDGNKYFYRAVESSVEKTENGSLFMDSFYDTDTTNDDNYTNTTIKNTLKTTQISGKKVWEDDGNQSKKRPEFNHGNPNVKLTLYKKIEGTSYTQVLENETPKVAWTDNGDNTWTWTYEKLPEFNYEGKAYTYAVKEAQVDGYKTPSYENTSGVTDFAENGGTIRNVITEIKLNKVSNEAGEQGERRNLNGVRLEIKAKTSGAEAAFWERTAEGTVTSGLTNQTNRYNGSIKGLTPGNYTVEETKTPEGYLTIKPFTFTLNADGSIQVADNSAGRLDGTDTLLIHVTDTKIRGAVELKKYLGTKKNPLAGVTFDLYRQAGTVQDPASDAKAAEGLTTDTNGVLRCDDLESGTYYFKETGATADSLLKEDLTSTSFTIEGKISNTEQPELQSITLENEAFAPAMVEFLKKDASSKEVITENVQFTLSYTPEEPKGYAEAYTGTNILVGQDGKVSLTGLKKGTYILQETSAEGYNLEAPFKCRFKITNDDSGKTIQLSNTTDYTRENGSDLTTEDNKDVLYNTRLPGSIEIKKVDGTTDLGLNGAQFTLYKTDSAQPEVCGTFESGKAYKSGGTGAFVEDESKSPDNGIVQITGLEWGKYKLQETKAPEGYVLGKDKDVTVEFEITRTNRNHTVVADGQTIRNYQNSVKLIKADADVLSTLLPGAEFTVAGDFAGDNIGETTKTYTIPDNSTGTSRGILEVQGDFIGGSTYTLTETKAPNGYEVSQSITFKVEEDGTVSIDGKKAEDNKVTVTDTKIALALKKQNTVGSELAGAEFTVSGQFAKEFQIEGKRAYENQTSLKDFDGRWLATTGITEGVDQFTYQIMETKAPAGYKLPGGERGTINFTVNQDGTIQLQEKDSIYKVDADGVTIVATDDPIELSIIKTDASGHVIGDDTRGYAKFKIEGTFADGTNAIENTTDKLTGELKGKLTAGQTYTLTETQTPNGYILPDPAPTAQFQVIEDGTIFLSDVVGGKWVQEQKIVNASIPGSISIFVKNDPGKLSLYKADMDGTAITGYGDAQFTVIPAKGETFADGTTEAVQVTTAEYGTAALDGKLTPGVEYIMTETKAPKGYQLAEPFTFTVNVRGHVTCVGNPSQATATGSNLTVKDQKIAVIFRKVDVDAVKEDNPAKLPGAEFVVSGIFTDADKTEITVTDNAKNALEGMLIATTGTTEGTDQFTYTVRETLAPEGYRAMADFSFTVDEHGKVTVAGADNLVKIVSGSADTVELAIANAPIQLMLGKMNQTDQRIYLAGAQLKLTPEPGSAFVDRTKKEIIVTTTEDPLAAVERELIVGHVYTLTEIKAPAGYILADPAPTVTFKVEQDGTMTFSKNVGTIIGNGTDTLTVFDRMTMLELVKVDNETKANVKGATLAIYKAEDFDITKRKPQAGTKAIASWTSDGKNAGRITNLDAGEKGAGVNYVLYEAVTPSGYDSFEPLAFTLHADNVITLAGDTRSDCELTIQKDADSGIKAGSITIKNTRIRGHVSLQKAVEPGKSGVVEGVEFSLYRQEGSKPDTTDTSKDEKIAERLTTNDQGLWTSKGNEADFFIAGEDKAAALSKGLPTGTYYFLETKATADTVLERKIPWVFTIEDSDQGAHGKTVDVLAENKAFAAAVSIVKLDEKSKEGIKDAEFELTYIPEHMTSAEKVTQTGATDAKGSLAFANLPKGTYTLTETKAAGYDISETHSADHKPFRATFTIGEADNGKTIEVNKANAEKVTLEQGAWTEGGVTNPRLLGSMTLYKADGDEVTTALNDVEFKLLKKSESNGFIDWLKGLLTGKKYHYQNAEAEEVKGTDLAAKGQLTITDLEWGTYQLVETKAKAGYSTTDKTSEEVLETIEFTIDRYSVKTVDLQTDGNKFFNYQTLLEIYKAGTNGTTDLEGARFILSGGSYVGADGHITDEPLTVITDSDGKIVLKGQLIGGETYTLKEAEAPLGYERITGELTFTMMEDGRVKVVEGAVGAADTEGYVLTSADFFGNVITAVDTPIQVQIAKADERGTRLLSGAVFEVTPEEGSAFAKEAVDGKIILTDANMEDGLTAMLIAGHTYILKETKAPNGYEKAAAVKFTVDADGEVMVTDGKDTVIQSQDAANADIRVLTVKDKPISVNFLKRMLGDAVETGIAGAQFKLTPQDDRTFADGSREIIFTTEGESYELNGILIGGDTYTLTETKAPEGAVAIPENGESLFTFTFTVAEDGSVTGLDTDERADGIQITYEAETDRITSWNAPSTLRVFKKSMDSQGTEEDKLLAGCVFEVTGRFAPDRYGNDAEAGEQKGVFSLLRLTGDVETITITTDGVDGLDNALKGRLIAGETYIIKEVMAPSGHELGNEVAFTIGETTIGADGSLKSTIVLAEDGKGYETEVDEDGNIIITQRDERIKVKLQKTDMNGTSLSGAKFDVTGIFESDTEESTRTFTADSEGMIDLSGILNECNETFKKEYIYKIEEAEAPEGYEKLTGSIYFKLVSKEIDGRRKTDLEVLYDGKTAEDVKQYLTIQNNVEDTKVDIMRIANRQIEKTPEDEGNGGTNDDPATKPVVKPAKKPIRKNSAKTGDQANPAVYGLLLLVSGMAFVLAGKRKKVIHSRKSN